MYHGWEDFEPELDGFVMGGWADTGHRTLASETIDHCNGSKLQKHKRNDSSVVMSFRLFAYALYSLQHNACRSQCNAAFLPG